MYDPVTYWKERTDPTPRELPDYAKEYIQAHIKDAETILDYGIGEGRLLPLYGDREVTGYDIVPRDLDVPVISELKGYYDCVVASKVLLHVLPENIERVMKRLSDISNKAVVYDTIAECKAPHNFNHDFESMAEMNDVIIKDKDLLFWYA